VRKLTTRGSLCSPRKREGAGHGKAAMAVLTGLGGNRFFRRACERVGLLPVASLDLKAIDHWHLRGC
jgi:hypothetical protein